MTSAQFRYDPENVAFTVGSDHTLAISRDDAIVAPLDLVANVPIAMFEQALRDDEDQDAATVSAVFLSDVPVDEFDPDVAHRAVSLSFVSNQLTVEVGRLIDSATAHVDAVELLSPLLQRHGAEARGSYRDDQEGHRFELHGLQVFREMVDGPPGELPRKSTPAASVDADVHQIPGRRPRAAPRR